MPNPTPPIEDPLDNPVLPVEGPVPEPPLADPADQGEGDPASAPAGGDPVTPESAASFMQGLQAKMAPAPAATPPAAPAAAPPAALPGDQYPGLSDEQLAKLGETDPAFKEVLASRQTATQASATAQAVLREVQHSQQSDSWLNRALNENPDLRSESGPMYDGFIEQTRRLVNGGYSGPDLYYQAAQLAKQSLNRSHAEERSRESRIDRSTSTPGATGPKEPRSGEGPQLSPGQTQRAKDWGITDTVALKGLSDELAEGRETLRRRG